MTEQMNRREAAAEMARAVSRGEPAGTPGTYGAARNSRPTFNRFIYQNLLVHIEGQIESWNRRAVREPNPEAAHALWLKAEGLGYALRLLYAFEPEFRELVECAARSDANGVS